MVNAPTTGPPGARTNSEYERQLREINEALLVSSIRQQELAEQAQRAEAGMRESEAIRHFALQGAGAGTWTWDAESGVVTWSAECYELFGIDPRTPLLYESWRNALHPEDRERADAATRRAMDLQEDLYVEYRIHHPERGQRWLTSIGRIIDPENRPGYMTGISLDITERKQAEKAMARLAAIVTSSEDAIFSKDLNGIITSWNKGAEHLFGYAEEEVIGKSVSLLIPEDHLDEEPRILERIRRGEALEHYETVRQRKDGTLLDVSLTVSPLRDATARIIGASKIARDITERVRLESKTRQQATELADLHRRKDEFLAMLSHELRNPLAPIANAVQLLRLEKNPGAIQEQARTIIERQVGQLSRLIEDLIEVSRLSTGRIHLQEERLDLRGVVERAVETVRPLIAQRRHALTVVLSKEPIWLCADAGRLEQVMVNLLTNAAKYTDPAGQIWLSADQAGDEAVMCIRDTGVGIAPELLPRVFDLFTQAERSLDRAQGGLGVGLALVRQIVQLHHGRVEATSVLGQGSEFVVRLPIVLSPAPPKALSERQPDFQNRSSCRVLVVDDNVDMAHSLTMLLLGAGYIVRTAHDGPGALAAALDFHPQAVFLDIGLPGIDGFDVAQRLRAEPGLERTLLVAVTGYGQASDEKRSEEAGFTYHLVKPVVFRSVLQILATVPTEAT